MPMTKAEMEGHRNQYQTYVAQARAAEAAAMYREAVAWALSSWDHIDGMMQYDRKYQGAEPSRIDGIDIVLRYAPLLFDSDSLDKLESLLKDQRRIAKNSSADLAGNLASARKLMWDAHRVWNDIEHNPASIQQEHGQAAVRENDDSVTGTWEEMGLLDRRFDGASYRFAFSTQLERAAFAKCPACGSVARGPKSNLLYEVKCPKCSSTVVFVILARET
jgi:hypothetical protein